MRKELLKDKRTCREQHSHGPPLGTSLGKLPFCKCYSRKYIFGLYSSFLA